MKATPVVTGSGVLAYHLGGSWTHVTANYGLHQA